MKYSTKHKLKKIGIIGGCTFIAFLIPCIIAIDQITLYLNPLPEEPNTFYETVSAGYGTETTIGDTTPKADLFSVILAGSATILAPIITCWSLIKYLD